MSKGHMEQRIRHFLMYNLNGNFHFLVLSWGTWEGVSVGYIVDAQ